MNAHDLNVPPAWKLLWVEDLPVLMTNRLMLRMALVGEEPEVVEYLRRNREHLRPWEPKREDHYFTAQAWVGAPERDQKEARSGEAYRFRLLDIAAATSGSKPVKYLGTISLRNIMGFPMHNATIGYSLDHSAEGQGLMREGVRAVIRFGFEYLNLRRIEACFMPNNVRSERLLTDLGFKIEGLLRSSLEVNGKWEDHNICSLINWNWRRI
jgi:[ribosomal protein S5]-alanine N-acetyltransferase